MFSVSSVRRSRNPAISNSLPSSKRGVSSSTTRFLSVCMFPFRFEVVDSSLAQSYDERAYRFRTVNLHLISGSQIWASIYEHTYIAAPRIGDMGVEIISCHCFRQFGVGK